MTNPKPPAKRGRPAKSDQVRTERVHARLTPAEKAKFLALGGSAWLSAQLEKANAN